MVINIHGLHFGPTYFLKKQLDEIRDEAQKHKKKDGPIIVCGDFNTWNIQRLKYVQQFAADLDLDEVLSVHKKKYGTPHPFAWLANLFFIDLDTDATLDRMFCSRDLEVLEAKRLGEEIEKGKYKEKYGSSDHQPLLLKVRLMKP